MHTWHAGRRRDREDRLMVHTAMSGASSTCHACCRAPTALPARSALRAGGHAWRAPASRSLLFPPFSVLSHIDDTRSTHTRSCIGGMLTAGCGRRARAARPGNEKITACAHNRRTPRAFHRAPKFSSHKTESRSLRRNIFDARVRASRITFHRFARF